MVLGKKAKKGSVKIGVKTKTQCKRESVSAPRILMGACLPSIGTRLGTLQCEEKKLRYVHHRRSGVEVDYSRSLLTARREAARGMGSNGDE